MKEFAIFRGTLWQSNDYCSEGHLLQPAKFHAIPTLSPMISTNSFLPYAMMLGTHEGPRRP